jgi:RNA polymerase sigma factor (sigma-70 family)
VARDQQVEDLEQFLARRGQALLRTAALLTGSIEAGEDLLQSAIERLLRQRNRLDGDPEGYLRRTLCNLATDQFRRRSRGRRKLLLLQAEAPAPADATAEVDLRDAMVRLLGQLPRQQRTVLVLRYWEQLNAAETAELLG